STVLSMHPLLMLVETIEPANKPAGENLLPVGPHLIIFYDEIRGGDQEKLLHHWQLNLPRLTRDNDMPKLTLSSGGFFNQIVDKIRSSRFARKTRTQMAQQVSKLIESRNLLGAIVEFKKISEAEPENLAIAARLGELYLHAGQREEAIDNFLFIAERCLDDGMV